MWFSWMMITTWATPVPPAPASVHAGAEPPVPPPVPPRPQSREPQDLVGEEPPVAVQDRPGGLPRPDAKTRPPVAGNLLIAVEQDQTLHPDAGGFQLARDLEGQHAAERVSDQHMRAGGGPLDRREAGDAGVARDPGCDVGWCDIHGKAWDGSRLRHVFINLLTNAAKYSPPGGAVTLGATVAPLGFIRFSVTDQGPGIPPEVLPHVFDRFYRAPGQTKTGAGLGLAIAREIVVAHGGSISCTSEVGQGTAFHFLLPR